MTVKDLKNFLEKVPDDYFISKEIVCEPPYSGKYRTPIDKIDFRILNRNKELVIR